MNKLKTESKIGIIVLATIALVIWGINFLKGKNVLKRSDVYYGVFEDIQGIGISAPVLINGYKVGMVNDIKFDANSLEKIVIAFTVGHSFKIPENSTVELHSADLLGSKALRILPSNNPEYHTYGDTLFSLVKQDMTAAISEQILPLKDKVESAVDEIDTLVATLNRILDQERSESLQHSLDNLNSISKNLAIHTREGGDLDETLQSLRDFSKMLADNKEKLDLTFTNLASLSDSIAKSNVQELISSLNSTLANSSDLLSKINSGEGSLGLLATNDSLYLNLNAAIYSLDLLLKDLNENPKRYVHFSLFGKKN